MQWGGWGGRGFGNRGGCPGPNQIGFGQAKALGIAGHNMVAGNVNLYNRGRQPYPLRGAGFRLGGRVRSPLNGNLRCPSSIIPAGGSLKCGFLAQTSQPLAYNQFAPYYIPDIGNAQPCLGQQPYPIQPFYGAAGPSNSVSHANAMSSGAVAKGLADALSQAFGGPAYSEAISNAKSFNGDAYSFANSVADAVYGPAEANAAAASETANGVANANAKGSASTIGGPASVNTAAQGTAWNGIATANSLGNGQAWGGPAFVNNNAAALGRWGAQATAAGRGQAWGGPAVVTSGAASNAGQGPSQALNQAWAASNQAALAAGSAQAKTGAGPAQAKSQSGAIVSGGNGGVAAATDKAQAVSGFGPTDAQVRISSAALGRSWQGSAL